MQGKESIQKTKMYFHNTLQILKSLFFEGYQKIPKPSSLNPFSCSKICKKDQNYTEFCHQWEYDLEMEMKKKNRSVEKAPITLLKNKEEEEVMIKEEKKSMKSLNSRTAMEEEEQEQCSSMKKKKDEEEGYKLARKMKELEMIDVSDVEHVLDVEEALHYYSRLKSPVYLDIVDKFFTDMYREFSVPQPSASLNSSKRRLGSIRL